MLRVLVSGPELLDALVSGVHSPCISLHLPPYSEDILDDIKQVQLAAPYLKDHPLLAQMVLDGWGIVVCKDKEECNHLFNQTVGDDGPTPLNPYDGPYRIHALTSLGNENT